MKIAVLVKQVIGSESALEISDNNTWVKEENASFVMNPPDNYAIEEGLTIKEKIGESEVVIVSYGPARVQKVIREGLAKGADRGIHIEESGQFETDPLSIGKSIVAAIKDENFDLILSGLQSDDTGMGQTGVLVGELLGMSTASLAIETEIDKEKIRVKRELESGWFQWVTLRSPASVSIQSGINQPRYPSLKGIMGAKKKEINVVTPNPVDQNQSIKKIYAPNSMKETVMVEGSADQVVEQLVNIFRNEIKIT